MPSLNPVLLSEARILAAYIIFIGSHIVFAPGKFPWMKIERPGAPWHRRYRLEVCVHTSSTPEATSG
jgi:hypothetical protein